MAAAVLASKLPWDGTPPPTTDVESLRPDGDTYSALCRFWAALKEVPGVGDAVASKLMYLRWPRATIILDSLVRDHYAAFAQKVGAEIRAVGSLVPEARDWRRLYTFAFQRDVAENRQRGAFDELREQLRAAHPDVGPGPQLAELPDLRLLDIIT